MSRVITQPLRAVPSGADALTVQVGVSAQPAWTWGPWTQYIASASAAVHIAGVTVGANGYAVTSHDYEFEIGIGAAASEVSIHAIRLWTRSTSNSQAHVALLPVPLGGFPAGSRVAVRGRFQVASGQQTVPLALLYYESYTSSHESGETAPMTSAPLAATMPSITPSGTGWANSSWVELLASAPAEAALLGINITRPVTNLTMEYDIGVGAAAAETVITTLRTATRDNATAPGMWNVLWLPAPHPVVAGTRVSVRMRKTGTSTTAHAASLLYIDGTALL